VDNKDLIALIIIGVLPWGLVMIHYLTRKHRSVKYFNGLQEKYSLTPGGNGNRNNFISGYYRSNPVQIEYFEPESKKKFFTKLTVKSDNPKDLEFNISKRKRSINPYYLNGSYMIEDKEFDDMFIIHTNDLERLKRMLDFNSRFKLQQVGSLGFNGEIRLKGNAFTYIEPGLLNSDTAVMKLELVLHELCDLADSMKYDEQPVFSN
jgi:hypothetical protein